MIASSSAREPRTYVLDTNVFVTAFRQYYAPDLCPGFWESLTYYAHQGRIASIDRVRAELLYPAGLVEWADEVARVMFVSTAEREVVQTFSEMQQWVRQRQQFSQAAEDEFSRVADGWLAAYGKVHSSIVVTHETLRPQSKSRVPLPNVCKQFGVQYQDIYTVLRELDIRFDWR